MILLSSKLFLESDVCRVKGLHYGCSYLILVCFITRMKLFVFKDLMVSNNDYFFFLFTILERKRGRREEVTLLFSWYL